jgi:hypothetical protein
MGRMIGRMLSLLAMLPASMDLTGDILGPTMPRRAESLDEKNAYWAMDYGAGFGLPRGRPIGMAGSTRYDPL